MLTIGQKIPSFNVIAVKPGFNYPEENKQSAFEAIREKIFPTQWKVPKNFTFVCPTEIAIQPVLRLELYNSYLGVPNNYYKWTY